MGLWAWGITQMLTPKFWKLVKKDGFLQTYIRGHKTRRHSHYVGGHAGPVKMAGQDEFGNRYYEDFDVDQKNQRRWVEYSDYFIGIAGYGDKVPPGWHGWLSHQYDDPPSDDSVFVEHHYMKRHTPNYSYDPRHYLNPGSLSPFNERDRNEFIEGQRNRRATGIKINELNEGERKMEGKRLVFNKADMIEDPMKNIQEYDRQHRDTREKVIIS